MSIYIFLFFHKSCDIMKLFVTEVLYFSCIRNQQILLGLSRQIFVMLVIYSEFGETFFSYSLEFRRTS